jgi:hypothetical protein
MKMVKKRELGAGADGFALNDERPFEEERSLRDR